MNPALSSIIADLVMYIHFGIVLFSAGGLIIIIAGAIAGWHFIRNRPFRYIHLATLVFVAVQSLLGRLCSLTLLESRLRMTAGETGYDRGFISHWVSSLLYWDLPFSVFTMLYTAVALLAIILVIKVPPEKKTGG